MDPRWPRLTQPACRRSWCRVRVAIAASLLLVTLQAEAAVEAALAEGAEEALGARVLAAVRDEVGALAEGLATHLAHVGLLTCRGISGGTSQNY